MIGGLIIVVGIALFAFTAGFLFGERYQMIRIQRRWVEMREKGGWPPILRPLPDPPKGRSDGENPPAV